MRKDASLIKKIRGCIACHAKQKKHKSVARGVRHLCDIPGYLVREVLASTTDKDISCFSMMSDDANMSLMVYVLGGNPKHKLPQRGMDCDELLEWCVKFAIQFGAAAVVSCHIDAEGYSAELDVGFLSMIIPGKPMADWNDDDILTHVQRRDTKAKAALPIGFTPRVDELGDRWHLRKQLQHR